MKDIFKLVWLIGVIYLLLDVLVIIANASKRK